MRLGIATLKQLKKTRLVDAFEAHCSQRVSENNVPGMVCALGGRPRRRGKSKA
jgi:hypothetical protein